MLGMLRPCTKSKRSLIRIIAPLLASSPFPVADLAAACIFVLGPAARGFDPALLARRCFESLFRRWTLILLAYLFWLAREMRGNRARQSFGGIYRSRVGTCRASYIPRFAFSDVIHSSTTIPLYCVRFILSSLATNVLYLALCGRDPLLAGQVAQRGKQTTSVCSALRVPRRFQFFSALCSHMPPRSEFCSVLRTDEPKPAVYSRNEPKGRHFSLKIGIRD